MCNGVNWKLYIVEKGKIVELNVAICNLQNIWGIQIQINHSPDRVRKDKMAQHETICETDTKN